MNALALTLVFHTSLLAAAPSYSEAMKDATANQRPLVVLVGADWCPGCVTMKTSTIPNLQRGGKLDEVAFAMVNYDRQPQLAQQLMRGGGIPQLIVFSNTDNGWRRFQLIGAQSAGSVEQVIQQAIRVQAHPVASTSTVGAE